MMPQKMRTFPVWIQVFYCEWKDKTSFIHDNLSPKHLHPIKIIALYISLSLTYGQFLNHFLVWMNAQGIQLITIWIYRFAF